MGKDEKLQEIHTEALRNFNRVQSALRDEREQSLEDRRFYSIAGAQWEGTLGKQFENKPKFEVNKIHLSVMRIINEYRNNRITVDYISKDGSDDSDLADTCDGLFRADERDSGAEEAYDNAFEEAVGGGFGALRLRADYEDDEDEDSDSQRIRIEPIYDADSSVFFDLDAKRQDKADAKHCFVIYSMTRESYKDRWGDDPASVTKEISDTEFDWDGAVADVVYIAEYYIVEEIKQTVIIYKNIAGGEQRYTDEDFKNNPDLENELLSTGSEKIREKKVKRKRVHKYLISGSRVLEDNGLIAGKNIPIIPNYGKRWFVDNIERCMGHVRLAKDMQRLKNMQISKLGEISALSTVAKPILTPEQISGFQGQWADDNIKNYPYLLLNTITDKDGNALPAGPLAYTIPPAIPPAMAALLQLTDSDMRDLLGNQQSGEQMMSNISGKAVEMIQSKLDMQTFIYMSNFAKCIRRVGEVWLSMAKDIYVEPGRKMKSIGAMEQIGTVELMRPVMNPETGEVENENDLSKATFDVAVDVGPSSTSRREATVRALTGMLAITTDPETSQVLQSMAIMNMDGEGISDVKDYFRKKMVTQGVLKPTDEEAEAMAANKQPSPQDKALDAMANEANAKAEKTKVDIVKTLVETEKTTAQTEQIKVDTESEKIKQVKEVFPDA